MKNSILSKTIIYIISWSLLIFITYPLILKAENADNSLKQAETWVKHQPVQFLENKGQMRNMAGKPVPFVLFKTEAPGMNMYITEKGLTYVFLKMVEEESFDKLRMASGGHGEPVEPSAMGEQEENKKVEWNRIDN